MIEVLERAILAEARKRLRKRQTLLEQGRRFVRKIQKRTGVARTTAEPAWIQQRWALDRHFDPRYCARHGRFLAKGIWASITSGTYRCRPTIAVAIPKPAGGNRTVHVFSIPDQATASVFTSRLIDRNTPLFSASSYAYQRNKSSLLAILRLHQILQREHVFLLELDFRDYFESLGHRYLRQLIDDRQQFLISHAERVVIRASIEHEYATAAEYAAGAFEQRTVGTPQGSSISLFLANVGLHELDLALDVHRCQYARYADDLVILTHGLEDALRAAELVENHCVRSGTSINRSKSTGIRMLSKAGAPAKSFNFLGHSLSHERISMAQKTVKRIKARVAKIIVIHLLQYIRGGAFNPARVGGTFVDWDMVTCINELRRYIYGGVSEAVLRAHLDGRAHLRRMSGPIAFYCLMDNQLQLQELDGWLISVLARAHAYRARVLAAMGHHLAPLDSAALVGAAWYTHGAVSFDAHVPSFLTAWRSARKCWERLGIQGVEVPDVAYDSDGI